MKKFVTCLTAALLITAASTGYTAAQAVGNAGNPGIIPPQARPHGRSYSEWSAIWWQWVYAAPTSRNPLFLDGNVDLSLHQPAGPVWFLGGMFTATEGPPYFYGHAVRTGTIPAGKALFFPVLNCEFANQEYVPQATYSISDLYGIAKASIDGNLLWDCEIDGVSVKNLWDPATKSSPYRVVTPVFNYWLPATDNVLQFWGTDVTGWVGPAVGDGVYLMLAPLSVGTHTIHLGGGTPGVFIIDITYNITVVP
jgi:hypothetical protein